MTINLNDNAALGIFFLSIAIGFIGFCWAATRK